ncbi:MAG: hypothetical protein WBV68_08215 [Exiguobacterium oxidotolerans]
MAIRTAIATGNFDNPATWSGGIIPGAGDNIVRNADVVLTFNVDTPLLGPDTSDDFFAVRGPMSGADSGGFVINSGITVRMQGSILTGGVDAYIQNNGGTIEIDSTYTQHIVIGNDFLIPGYYISGGSVSQWSVIRSVGTGTTYMNSDYSAGDRYYCQHLMGSYQRLENIQLIHVGLSSVIDHWVLDDACGDFRPKVSINPDDDYCIRYCTFLNPSANVYATALWGGSGIRCFEDNVLMARMVYPLPHLGFNYDYKRCYFLGANYHNFEYLGTFEDCVVQTNFGVFDWFTDSIKNCFIYSRAADDPRFFQSASLGVDCTVEFCIFEYLNIAAVTGRVFSVPSPAFGVDLTIRNCIVLPDRGGDGSGYSIVALGNANININVHNCTYSIEAVLGNTYNGHANMVEHRNNLLFDTVAGSVHLSFSVGAVNSIVELSDYNSCQNGTNPYSIPAQSTKYGTPPGGSDLNDDPQLTDQTRDFASWSVDILGCPDPLETDQQDFAISTILGLHDVLNPDHNPDSTVYNLLSYIREGFKPLNGRYRTEGAGGVYPEYIGAVEPDVDEAGPGNGVIGNGIVDCGFCVFRGMIPK